MLSYPDFAYRQLVVHIAGGSGERLRFRADTIVVEDAEGKTLLRHSCHRLFALFIIGECMLTSTVVHHAVRFGFPIILMNRNLKVIAAICCSAEGNTSLRRRQYNDDGLAIHVARNLVRQKIDNQILLMKRLRYRSADDQEALAALSALTLPIGADTAVLRGIEGTASRIFFSAYFRPMGWNRREPRCRRDPYNTLLDIGYTYLFNFVDALLSLYGFDLYCGVYHTFFYQRKSLVCDLVEPFRCIIDRRLRKAHNLGQIDPSDFTVRNGMHELCWKRQEKYTRLFLKDLLQEKEALFRYIHAYYRWMMKADPAAAFPVYAIGE